MSAMKELIDRLENAFHVRADRELDGDIFLAVMGWPLYSGLAGRWVTTPSGGAAHLDSISPRYTESIDAAMPALVPPNCTLQLVGFAESWSAHVRHNRITRINFGGCASTPARAICIAALKARRIWLSAQKRGEQV